MDQRQFSKLKDKWYKKLKDEGFNDIEYNEDKLKLYDSTKFPAYYNEVTSKAKEDYYRLAVQFCSDHKFKTKYDKAVWELHALGDSAVKIAKALKSRNFNLANKSDVDRAIQRLRREMINYVNR